MSTRSGKRIHKSLHETVASEIDNVESKKERKTRSRRLKENENLNISLPKTKKRNNYVSYPTEEYEINGTADPKSVETEQVRTLRKYALKEINYDGNKTTNDAENDKSSSEHNARQTRRTKKFAETAYEENLQNETDEKNIKAATKKKKSTKKKHKESEEIIEAETEVRPVSLKKSRRKKKGEKHSNSSAEVFHTAIKEKQKLLNNTNTSVESFHSATGSPTSNNVYLSLNATLSKTSASKQLKDPDATLEKVADELSSISCDDPVENHPKRKRSSRLSQVKINFDQEVEPVAGDITTVLNATFDKDDPPQMQQQNLNSTFDKDLSLMKSLRISQSTIEVQNNTLNKEDNIKAIHDKSLDRKTLDTPKLNSTFDKETKNPNSESSSSTDLTVNLTFDKSDDNNMSRISITSDDSKVSHENILNATPVLIESSIDTSNFSEPSPEPTQAVSAPAPLTREGTFTKDGPDPIIVEKSTTSMDCSTPTKSRMTLPSPGNTPFHSNTKKSNCERIMNVTRSIEKPSSFSFVEQTRTTKVMFCSPVDNPILNTEKKTKIIKSSMKGSNKSFLFEEKRASQGSSRKRSFAQSESDEQRAKRKRLADDIQQSVDRLSRPRTSSAQDKTPTKRPVTPKAKSETKVRKLPNFAALHQKQFQKMESLDECQERKAKRAKQLLVPSGSLAVLDRSSPKTAAVNTTKEVEAKKPPPPPAQAKTEPKKGYTRFGYKLNLDVNPFSIPSKKPAKTETHQSIKPVTVSLNGGLKKAGRIPTLESLKRLPSLPSLSGVTQPRREQAKQVIMREKSATTLKDLGNLKRNENRTIIKGVRTNRRFELQMMTRNING